MITAQTEKPSSIPSENYPSIKKRTRATAKQLNLLEDTFAVNVSPNSKLRKQLAEQLGMTERSIQIWFQNKRAKVKHLQKKSHLEIQQAALRANFVKPFYPWSPSPQLISPSPTPHQDDFLLDPTPNLAPFIFPEPDIPTPEMESSCYVPVPMAIELNVAVLTIGIWQRMKYPTTDLICCYENDTFIWLIQEGPYHFKIEIPLLYLIKLESFAPSELYLHLVQPPLFYMRLDTQWIQCSDFTEKKQASQFFCHSLKGPGIQQDLLRLIQLYPHLSQLTFIHFPNSFV